MGLDAPCRGRHRRRRARRRPARAGPHEVRVDGSGLKPPACSAEPQNQTFCTQLSDEPGLFRLRSDHRSAVEEHTRRM
ncbi:hypothetical protein ACFPRL_02240 [Pseudoclavibacter helvolus]